MGRFSTQAAMVQKVDKHSLHRPSLEEVAKGKQDLPRSCEVLCACRVKHGTKEKVFCNELMVNLLVTARACFLGHRFVRQGYGGNWRSDL